MHHYCHPKVASNRISLKIRSLSLGRWALTKLTPTPAFQNYEAEWVATNRFVQFDIFLAGLHVPNKGSKQD
jgi:hypothetical protein